MVEYHWKAIYEDGSEFPQFDKYGCENKYPKIDRKRLSKFVMMGDGNKPKLVIHLDKHKRLICRMRTEKTEGRVVVDCGFCSQTGKIKDMTCPRCNGKGMYHEPVNRVERIWLVGWQENRNGVNIQSVFALFEDGHIEARDKFKENDPWFYSPGWSLEDRLDGIKEVEEYKT